MENSYGIEIEQLKKSLNRDRSQKEFEFFNEFCLCSLDLHTARRRRWKNITKNFDFITTTYSWSCQETCTLNSKKVWISHVHCSFRESNSATAAGSAATVLLAVLVSCELNEMSSWVAKLNSQPIKAENQNKAPFQLP